MSEITFESAGYLVNYYDQLSRCTFSVQRTVFFRHFKVRWIVQESPIYHRVEGSLLYQNPLAVNSAKFSFSRYTT